jgi:hypothetical protein
VVEFGFVGLELREVAVVEVSGAFQLDVVEDDNATALVSNREMLPFAIKCNCRKGVSVGSVLGVPLAETVYVDPSDRLVSSIRILTRPLT